MPQHDSIERLQRLMIDGGEKAFDLVPTTLVNVIIERQWADKSDSNGNIFASFEAFVDHRLPEGLESNIDDLRAYCRKRPDVQKLIDDAMLPLADNGGDRNSEAAKHQFDNVKLKSGIGGNSRTYTLRRLKRDRPDLADKVIAGRMSTNAAAIEAGIRKKPKKQKWVCPKCGCDAVQV